MRVIHWEYNLSVQHQLIDRLSITAGFYRRQFFNLNVTDHLNLAGGRAIPDTLSLDP